MTNRQNKRFIQFNSFMTFSLSVMLILITYDYLEMSSLTYASMSVGYVMLGIVYAFLTNKEQFEVALRGKENPMWVGAIYGATTIFTVLMIIFGEVDYWFIWVMSWLISMSVGVIAYNDKNKINFKSY